MKLAVLCLILLFGFFFSKFGTMDDSGDERSLFITPEPSQDRVESDAESEASFSSLLDMVLDFEKESEPDIRVVGNVESLENICLVKPIVPAKSSELSGVSIEGDLDGGDSRSRQPYVPVVEDISSDEDATQ